MSAGSVLVTGGAGFIGRRLVRRLLDHGRRVVVLDSLAEAVHGPEAEPPAELEGARFLQGDVRDAGAWEEALDGVELVYHLAAETGTGESMYRARRYVDVNVAGTALLCDLVGASRNPPRRVVLASSRAVYGEGPWRCPVHGVVHPDPRPAERLAAGEWDPVCPGCGAALEPRPAGRGTPARPASVYGLTKRDQEELLLTLLPPRGVEVVALRLQNVYGAGQSLRNPYTGILSIFAVRLLDGDGVSVFEDGRESRDFIPVEAVAEAFVRAGEVGLGAPAAGGGTAVVDVGTGRPVAILEAARALARACGAGEERVAVTGEYRVGDVRHAFCDPGPMRELLGMDADRDLEAGLEALVAWARSAAHPDSRLEVALDEMRSVGLLGRAGAG